MKRLLPVLLLASAGVFAQSAPPQGQPARPDFGRVKQMMLPMMEKSLSPLEQTRDCLAQSQNSADLNKCAAIMLDFQQAQRAAMGMPQGGPHGKPLRPEDLNLEWSPEMKQAMLKDVERSIQGTRAMIDCLKSSNNDREMTGCVERSGLIKKKP